MIFKNSKNQQQFGLNIVVNVAVYIFSLAVGLFLTPFLIKNLGIASYGLVPLANNVIFYVTIITGILTGVVGRFLAIDLQRDEPENANQTFNTGLVASLAIATILLPLVIGFSIRVPSIFNIPKGEERSAQLLFLFVSISFLISVIENSFTNSSWAKSRFELRNIVVIISTIINLIIIVIFFKIDKPSVWQIGVALLLKTLVGLIGDIIIWKRITPQLHIHLRQFKFAQFREFFGMGGWMVIDQAGTLLFLNIDLIIANKFLGSKSAGQYGSILLFSSLLRGLAAQLTTIWGPSVVAKYAVNDLAGVTRISKQAIRLMGLALALPVGMICGLGGPFLQLWLGHDFGSLWPLLVLLTFHLSINLAISPLGWVQTALNKVKIPGIVTLSMGILNLLMALYFTVVLKWGVFGIAAAGAIVLTCRNVFFTSIYGAHIQNLPWYTYLQPIVPGMLTALLVGLLSFGITALLGIDNWISMILTGAIIGSLSLGAMFLLGLKEEDKSLVLGYIPVLRRT